MSGSSRSARCGPNKYFPHVKYCLYFISIVVKNERFIEERKVRLPCLIV